MCTTAQPLSDVTYLLVTIHELCGRVVVIPVGEIDLGSGDTFSDALADCHGNVVVDLAGVQFLSSTGISVVIAHRKRLAAAGGSLALRRPQPNVRRVFEVIGMSGWLAD